MINNQDNAVRNKKDDTEYKNNVLLRELEIKDAMIDTLKKKDNARELAGVSKGMSSMNSTGNLKLPGRIYSRKNN